VQFYVGADNLVEAYGVVDEVEGVHTRGATLTATLYDAAGTTVVAGPVPMTPIDGTVADYRGKIPYTAPVVKGKTYVLEVLIAKGDFRVPVRESCVAGFYRGRSR
jgi:hypothetical protein